MPEDAAQGNGDSQATNVDLGSQVSTESGQHPGQGSGENGNAQQQSAESGGQQNKRESRYERTKRERAEFKRAQEAFRAQQEAFARERAQFEDSKRPKRDYTLQELRKYRNEWANEGNFDLVEKADKEISLMEAEAEAERKQRTVELPRAGSPEHTQAWQAAEKELAEADSEFMRPGTRLDGKLREIMASKDGDIYRQHPRGIVAAYHRARMELLQEDNVGLQTENSKLKNELSRLTGLTSIDGGALSKLGGGEVPFDRLSSADMRKRLLKTARSGSLDLF